VPLSGSAYTFSYVALGELIGWFIGWNLTLEYGFSAAAVARGWSSYLVQFLRSVGVTVPRWLAGEIVIGGWLAPAPFAALICGTLLLLLYMYAHVC
jgi:APA family basic amino acid/polyamine antiporter